MTGAAPAAAEAEWLMRQALRQAEQGLAEDEVPIGCVIARPFTDGWRIVAHGHNRVSALQRRTAHAEMIAFENGGARGRRAASLDPQATDAVLVSTLEPCVMCLGATMEAGIALVLYGLPAPADGGAPRVDPPQSPHTRVPHLVGGLLAADSRALFVRWLRRNPRSPSADFVRQLLALTLGAETAGPAPGHPA